MFSDVLVETVAIDDRETRKLANVFVSLKRPFFDFIAFV